MAFSLKNLFWSTFGGAHVVASELKKNSSPDRSWGRYVWQCGGDDELQMKIDLQCVDTKYDDEAYNLISTILRSDWDRKYGTFMHHLPRVVMEAMGYTYVEMGNPGYSGWAGFESKSASWVSAYATARDAEYKKFKSEVLKPRWDYILITDKQREEAMVRLVERCYPMKTKSEIRQNYIGKTVEQRMREVKLELENEKSIDFKMNLFAFFSVALLFFIIFIIYVTQK